MLLQNAANFLKANAAHPEFPITDGISEDISLEFGKWMQSKKTRDFYESLFKSRDEIILEVKGVIARLNSKSISNTIRKVVICRDKMYAHHDPNSIIEYVNLNEIEVLIDEACDIFNIFYLRLFGTSILFGFVSGGDIEYVIQRLNVLRQKVNNELEQLKHLRESEKNETSSGSFDSLI